MRLFARVRSWSRRPQGSLVGSGNRSRPAWADHCQTGTGRIGTLVSNPPQSLKDGDTVRVKS